MPARRFDSMIEQLLDRCGAVAHISVAVHIYNSRGLAGSGAYAKLASMTREGRVESVPLHPNRGGASTHCVIRAGASHSRLAAKCQVSETVLARAREGFRGRVDADGRVIKLRRGEGERAVVSDLYEAGEDSMIERMEELHREGVLQVEISDADPVRRARLVQHARALGLTPHACRSFVEHTVAMKKPK